MTESLYQVRVPQEWRSSSAHPPSLVISKPGKIEENLPKFFRGKEVKSVLEARSIVALLYLKQEFTYQAVINRGRQVRGGQVLDFLVDTYVMPTAVYVNGGYWHGTSVTYEDKIRENNLRGAFHGRVIVKVLWENQLLSVSQAISTWAGVLR